MELQERNEIIRSEILGGLNYAEVGIAHGLTRERVRQIAGQLGVEAKTSFRLARERKIDRVASKAVERAVKKAVREANLARAKELVAGGMSIAKAAVACGFSRGQIQHIAAAERWPTRFGRWRPELTFLRAKAVELYRGGMTVKAASLALGVSTVCVENALDKAGEPRRPRLRAEPRAKPRSPSMRERADEWPQERVEVLLASWRALKTASQIAAELGPPMTRSAVLGKLHRLRNQLAREGASGVQIEQEPKR